MAKVVLENIYKSFPRPPRDRQDPSDTLKSQSVSVLRAINLTIADGEFMVLVGPSGCGKSTLLRLICGLEEPTGGNIWIGDRLVNGLPPKERDIAMVFQGYALYPHLSVYENIAFGLRRAKIAPDSQVSEVIPGEKAKKTLLPPWLAEIVAKTTRSLPKDWRYLSESEQSIDRQVRAVARRLQLEPLLERLPKQLSGGQKQRVALGRAIARNPQVFLMDEPLSNLDAQLRAETRGQILRLQRQLDTTTIYVTHDQTEAMTMGDRIVVLNGGEIQQVASPLQLYHQPANQFVAQFIGSPPMNLLPVEYESLTLIHPQFRCNLPPRWQIPLPRRQSLTLGIRPEHLHLAPPGPATLALDVELVEALGNDTYVTGCLNGDRATGLQVRLPPEITVSRGETLTLAMMLDKIHLFDPTTGLAIQPEPN